MADRAVGAGERVGGVMRHPDLHQSPEVLSAVFGRTESVVIEIGQHDDGRWMWATRVQTANTGYGYACGAKWKRFAESRAEAFSNACNEIASTSYITARIREWLASLQPAQVDLFA